MISALETPAAPVLRTKVSNMSKHRGAAGMLALIANLWGELAREDQIGRILKTSRGADFNLRC